MKLGETSTDIPIELCELHPLTAGMRIDIEKNIDELADDIRRHKQMQPGRVILARGKYLVYMGSRRFLGCKLLFGKGKLKTYKAFIDDDLTDEEIIERALAENATENKSKLGVRLLEELHYFSSLIASKSYTPQQIQDLAREGGMKKEPLSKKLAFLKFLTAEDCERLYRAEEETGFVFDLDLLTGIWQFCNGDRPTFLGACAYAAKDGDWTVKGLNEDLVLGAVPEALKIPWFSKIFPGLMPQEIPEPGEEGDDEFTDEFLKSMMKTGDRYCYVACKKCGFEIPIDYDLQSKGIPAATAYKFKEDGTTNGNRTELNRTYDCMIECKNCGTPWKLVLKPAGKEKIHMRLEDPPQEEEEASSGAIEKSLTSYSPAFNQFILIDQDVWYFYDTALGRRRPMNDEEIEKHRTHFSQRRQEATASSEPSKTEMEE